MDIVILKIIKCINIILLFRELISNLILSEINNNYSNFP